MTAHIGAAATTDESFFAAPPTSASEQSEQSLARRLINVMFAGRNQDIEEYVRSHREEHQNQFRVEFERRLLGQ
jgi:hypothetical protein